MTPWCSISIVGISAHFYMRTDNYAMHPFIVDRGVYMRVHKHSCDVLGLCVFFRNILQKQQSTFSMFTC